MAGRSQLGVRRSLRELRRAFFHLNFYRLHLLYFVLVIIVASGILYGSNTAGYHMAYVDALSLCTSAMCNVGLNTVDLGSLNGFQQSVLFVLMLMGDLTLVTISVVVVRRYYFSRKMRQLVQNSDAGRHIAEDVEKEHCSPHQSRESTKRPRTDSNDLMQEPTNDSFSHMAGYGSFPAPWSLTNYLNGNRRAHTKPSEEKSPPTPHYLSFSPELDHKGRFTSLSPEQENELGGLEYRALKVLTWLLPAYTVFWLFIIMVVLTPYATRTNTANIIRTSQPGDLNPAWWAVFISVSGYTNTGLDLVDQSMIPFQRDYLILIFVGAAILGGNTLYPVFLRLSIWTLSKCSPRHSELHHSFSFLLQHPRRCYLLLFPSKNTWLLFASQVGITILAWLFFLLLNINQTTVDPGFPGGQRTMDGLFQALGVRSSGFYIITLSEVVPSLQFFYMVTMYISAFPVILSLRESNVYEERSLGQDDASRYGSKARGKHDVPKSQIGTHVKKQLAYDLWWLLLAVFLISIIEHAPLTNPATSTTFTLFSILFEVVSAYGTVGLSLGVPHDSYSFSGAWRVLSKLILLTVMLRGRHRILPLAIDRAVLIPGQKLMHKLDQEQYDSGRRWDKVEEKIRADERGEQAEREVKNQQDPE